MLSSYSRLPIPTKAEQVLLGRAIRAWLDWEPGPEERKSGITKPPRRIQRAGMRARTQLVSRNMLLVAREARSFSISSIVGLEIQDLIQEGAVGLCRAAEKFDPSLGYAFSTYAVLWIRQSMTQLLHSSGTIRIPTKRSQAMHKLRQWIEAFTVKVGRPPTDEESLRSGIAGVKSLDDLRILRDAAMAYQVRSLDSVIKDDDGDTLINVVAAPANEGGLSEDKECEMVVSALRPWPKLQETLQRRFAGQCWADIGVAMGISTRVASRRGEMAWMLAKDLLQNTSSEADGRIRPPALEEAQPTHVETWQPTLF